MSLDDEVFDFLEDIVDIRTVTWYKRIKLSSKPSSIVNIDSANIPSTALMQENLMIRVSEQPVLYTNMGGYVITIRRSPGRFMGEYQLRYSNVESGRYDGTCVVDYEIAKEDHLVDADGEEYVVISADASNSRKFRHLELIWLPKVA